MVEAASASDNLIHLKACTRSYAIIINFSSFDGVLAVTVAREFSTAVQTAESWVDDLAQRLGWRDRERGYTALLATLHAVRDCLAGDEAIYLGAQLPPLLRGLYYEGWHPGRRSAGRSRSAFLQRIHESLDRDPGIDPEQVARAVLALLATRMPAAEVEDAKAATPQALHSLWPS